LQAGREKRVVLFTCTPLLSELTDILGRRKFEKKIDEASLSVDQLVNRYAKLAALVRPMAISPTIHADPDDDQVLACALAAHADLIVSGDRHLLSLDSYGGIAIVTVAQAVKFVGG